MTNFDAWLAANADPEVPGFSLPALTEDDIASVDHPDRDPAAALGAVADAVSVHSLDQHAAFVLLADQSVVNPDDYTKYDRTFPEGGECFDGQGCDLLRTWNDIIKNAAFNVTIPYQYEKDYRWVQYETAEGDARTAMVAQGSVPIESFGDDGTNGILQSYTLDVFLGQPDGGIHRVQAQWTELALALDPGADYLTQEAIDGLQGVFADTDTAIESIGL
jgi:hypothetical protein